MIYFDNSATTLFKPKCVIDSATSVMRHLSANPGRSSHELSLKCAQLVYKARVKIAEEVGSHNGERVIFTSNCSEALNLAILGSMKKGHVITTCFEHNSVLRPLFNRVKSVSDITVLQPLHGQQISARQVEDAIRHDTYLVIVNHVSNVTGQIMPIEEIGRVCKRHGVLFAVDGAQSVGYMDINMKKCGIDMLAIAPHKGLHALQGVGILVLSEKVKLSPFKFGGTGTSSFELNQPTTFPEGYEVGTLPLFCIGSLIPAISYNKKYRQENARIIAALSEFLLTELSNMKNVNVLTPTYLSNGIISFNVGSYSSVHTCDYLSSQHGICTRCGLHCAPLVHKLLGTIKQGCVRVSLGADNTIEEAETLIKALYKLEKQ